MDEKREQPRFEVCLTARWCGSTAHQPVRISDLSEGGCYIDTIVEVTVNEIIKIEVALSDGSWLQLKGVVAHHFPRLGFGVRFLDLDDEQLKSLRSLLPGHEVSDRAKATPDLENSETQRNGDVAPIDDAQLASGSLM